MWKKYRKVIDAIFLGFFILLIASCTSEENNYPWKIGEKSAIDIYKEDAIVLLLDESTLTASGAEFTLKSAENITYGEQFFLEIQINGKWYTIEEELDWFLTKHILKSGEEVLLEIDWTNYYGELPSGRYRLLKPIENIEKSYVISCEFEV